jgi:hypothetical protein
MYKRCPIIMLLARLSVDFGDNDFCAFRRHRARCGAADARPRAPAPVISATLPSSRAIAKLPYLLSSRVIWSIPLTVSSNMRPVNNDQYNRKFEYETGAEH